MKNLLPLVIVLFIFSCSENNSSEDDLYTGREISYELRQASGFPISGEVTFVERSDLAVEVRVHLSGTSGDIYHPVHLHNGDLSVPDAEILFLLNDVYGSSGESTTLVRELNDGSKFTFDHVQEFEGSVKVHLASYGPEADVVLAGGNIGAAKTEANENSKIAVCKSE